MNRDEPLFTTAAPRLPRGRVRIGLDQEIETARAAGVTLAPSGVALLRSLADQIDQLERLDRSSDKPYDRVPLGGLMKVWMEVHPYVFAPMASTDDPFTRVLADLLAAETGNPAGTGNPD